MSQIFDALQRSGVEIAGLDPSGEPSSHIDPAGLDQAPAFAVNAQPESRLVALADELSAGAERIRMLAARLRQLQHQRPVRTLLITSSIKDEGKSLLSTNLACSLARMKQRVLLIDGDCHQGSLARLLGTSALPGLTGWWRANNSIVNYFRRANDLPLWFLAAGEPSTRVVEMLQSTRFSEMLNHAASWFDWIVVDSPPCAPLADSASWANVADAILLVVRLGKTPRKVLEKARTMLDQQKLLGVVLNDCSDPHSAYYAQYYKGIKTAQGRHSRG